MVETQGLVSPAPLRGFPLCPHWPPHRKERPPRPNAPGFGPSGDSPPPFPILQCNWSSPHSLGLGSLPRHAPRCSPQKSLRKLRSPRCQKTVPPPGCPPPGRSAAFRSHPPLWRASHTSCSGPRPVRWTAPWRCWCPGQTRNLSAGPAHRPPESPLGLSSCLRRSIWPPWSAVWRPRPVRSSHPGDCPPMRCRWGRNVGYPPSWLRRNLPSIARSTKSHTASSLRNTLLYSSFFRIPASAP